MPLLTRRTAGWLLAGVVALEVAIPAVGLATTEPPRRYSWSMFVASSTEYATTEPPRRYSWSMFVASSTEYAYTGRTADGASRVLDTGALPWPQRTVHYGATVPGLLCAATPDLVSVSRTRDGAPEWEQPC